MSSHQQTGYEEYLASMHGSLTTSEELIRDVVKEGLEQDLLTKTKIIAGEVNEVYDITLKNQQHIILRISRHDFEDFLQEKWAIQQCKKIGIPVPEIFFIKHLKINDRQFSFCLMEKIEGKPLERGGINFDELSLELKKDLVKQAGEILSKIHSIPTHGFGWIIEAGKPQFKTSQELINNLLEKQDHLEQIAAQENFDKSNINKALRIIENFKDQYAETTAVLNHGDYSNKHFMVRDNKIVSILDWGGVRTDSPVYDFANWDYWFGDQIPTEWLKTGYTDKKLFTENFEEFLHIIRLFRGLEIFDWYHTQNYKQAVNDSKEKLLNDLKYFQ